jgi:hypothetical protein
MKTSSMSCFDLTVNIGLAWLQPEIVVVSKFKHSKNGNGFWLWGRFPFRETASTWWGLLVW